MTNSTDLLTPNGTYIIMNAATHTYLNVLNFGGPGTAIVCSVGNDLGNDIVSCRAHTKTPSYVDRHSGTT